MSEAYTCPEHGPFGPARFCCACTRKAVEVERDLLRAENEALKADKQGVLDVVNLYGDELLHSALDSIGWVTRSAQVDPGEEARA